MTTVRVYSNVLLARQAAEYLLASGIIATAGAPLDPMGGYPGVPVAIGDRDLVDRARALLDEFETTSPDIPSDWELQTIPDLSRLPARTSAPCPRCNRDLPLDTTLEHCPACGAPADVVEILFTRHGPDVLALCFDDQRPLLPDDIVDNAPLRCPRCEYPLTGLSRRARCPECGLLYSKDDLLRGP